MIVRLQPFIEDGRPTYIAGELVEKATRVLTPEEQRIFDVEWIGKDGSKRKLEVRSRPELPG